MKKKLTKAEEKKVRDFADLILAINGKTPKQAEKKMLNGKATITISKNKKEQLDREKRFKKALIEIKKVAKLNGYNLEEISLKNLKKY